jgi:hypothetical protein
MYPKNDLPLMVRLNSLGRKVIDGQPRTIDQINTMKMIAEAMDKESLSKQLDQLVGV